MKILKFKNKQKFNLKSVLNILKPNCRIIDLDEVTEGAACTTLLAKKYIDNDKPLMIANSDQFINRKDVQVMTLIRRVATQLWISTCTIL